MYNNIKTYNNNSYIIDTNQRPNSRFKVVNLSKTYKSFEEGYAETISFIPEIKAYGGDDPLYISVITSILNTIKDNIPVHYNSLYPNTFSFSIDSHELGFKTDSGIAFGWRTFYERESGAVYYRFRISFIIVHTQRKNTIQKMEKNGWTVFETQRQSRFWDKIEGKDRYSNRERHTQNSTVTDINVAVEDKITENAEDIVVANTTEESNAPSVEPEVKPESDYINEDIANQLKDFKAED